MTKITITKNAMAKLAAMTTTGSMTMTDEELARHDSKTLLQLLLSADARCDALAAERDCLRAVLEGLMAHEPDYSDTLWQNAHDALKGETP